MENLKTTQSSNASNDLFSANQHLIQIDHQLSTIYNDKAVSEFPLIKKTVSALKSTVEEIGHRIKNMDDTSVVQELYGKVMGTINLILGSRPKGHRVAGLGTECKSIGDQ